MEQMIRELALLPGISGQEDAVRTYLCEKLRPYGACRVDALGNVIFTKQGRQRAAHKIVLSAHMDEVGFLITYIAENGYLHFAPVGGIDAKVVVGKTVKIGAAGIAGVIGVKPVHLCSEEEREQVGAFSDLRIDIGAGSRAEAEKLVTPGDMVVFDAPYTLLGEDRIVSKALDDRAGCAMLLQLAMSDLPYDCIFCFTVQEETGTTGAVTAGHQTDAEICIAVETTTASDIAGVGADRQVCRLGQGPVLSFMDRGTIYDRGLYCRALSVAEAQGIRCQVKEGVYGGNESRAYQKANGGAKVLAVSLPCRYLHASACMLSRADIGETVRLLRALSEAFAQ